MPAVPRPGRAAGIGVTQQSGLPRSVVWPLYSWGSGAGWLHSWWAPSSKSLAEEKGSGHRSGHSWVLTQGPSPYLCTALPLLWIFGASMDIAAMT